jgi:hypothetical protein
MKRLFVIITLAASLFSGCDIFNTREPEKPDQPATNAKTATDPQQLIDNFTASIQQLDLDNYMACFSDSLVSGKNFDYVPSSEASLLYPSLSGNWDLRSEKQYFTNMKAKLATDAQITISFSNSFLSPLGDSATYIATYFLNVPHTDSFSKIFQGDIKLKLFRDTRLIWRIYYWQDSKNGNNANWSELKGRMY